MKPPLPRCGKSAGLAVALALLLSVAAAHADRPVVYRWVDERGIVHFTTQSDRIPSEFRESVQELGKPPETGEPVPGVSAAPPAPAAAAAPPPAPPAPSAPTPLETKTTPSGTRVMPEGEFEEPPLGTHSSAPVAPPESPTPRPDTDVAAPPPGFIRGTPSAPGAGPPAAPASAAAAAAPSPTPLAPGDASALDDRIAALEEQVHRDETAIQAILSEPRVAEAPRVADRSDFREIAGRLPKLQADLKALREQRARQSGP
jgi:hypothetical protein